MGKSLIFVALFFGFNLTCLSQINEFELTRDYINLEKKDTPSKDAQLRAERIRVIADNKFKNRNLETRTIYISNPNQKSAMLTHNVVKKTTSMKREGKTELKFKSLDIEATSIKSKETPLIIKRDNNE